MSYHIISYTLCENCDTNYLVECFYSELALSAGWWLVGRITAASKDHTVQLIVLQSNPPRAQTHCPLTSDRPQRHR